MGSVEGDAVRWWETLGRQVMETDGRFMNRQPSLEGGDKGSDGGGMVTEPSLLHGSGRVE